MLRTKQIPRMLSQLPKLVAPTQSGPVPSFSTASTPLFAGVTSFLTLRDFSPSQILYLVKKAIDIKAQVKAGIPSGQPFAGKTLGMVFSKRSTRTRVSCESGWAWYGGHPMFLGMGDIQVGGGAEPWKDTSIVLGSMVDCVLARLGEHEEVEELAKYSSSPVINGLTAKFHPLQILADIMTIYETFSPDACAAEGPLPHLPGLKVAWVGDGNNILNDLLVALPRIGISLAAATPRGYDCPSDVLDFAKRHSRFEDQGNQELGALTLTHDPLLAVKDADVVVTDTWISMGQESDKAKRLQDFSGYQISEAMATKGGAKPSWKFMHCLPRKPQEVDDEVFYGPRSIVWQEAENRKYTVMAVYEALMIDARKVAN